MKINREGYDGFRIDKGENEMSIRLFPLIITDLIMHKETIISTDDLTKMIGFHIENQVDELLTVEIVRHKVKSTTIKYGSIKRLVIKK